MAQTDFMIIDETPKSIFLQPTYFAGVSYSFPTFTPFEGTTMLLDVARKEGDYPFVDSPTRIPVKKACDQCRSDHRACDGTSQCTSCNRRGYNCTYVQDPTKKMKF